MPKTEKALTKGMLTGMQVIDAEGNLVGKVKDVAFAIGKSGISLSVEKESGEEKTVPWDEVQAAGDFIILKPTAETASEPAQTATATSGTVSGTVQTQTTAQSSQPLCPTCGKPLSYIQQYQRWYCYNEKKYV